MTPILQMIRTSHGQQCQNQCALVGVLIGAARQTTHPVRREKENCPQRLEHGHVGERGQGLNLGNPVSLPLRPQCWIFPPMMPQLSSSTLPCSLLLWARLTHNQRTRLKRAVVLWIIKASEWEQLAFYWCVLFLIQGVARGPLLGLLLVLHLVQVSCSRVASVASACIHLLFHCRFGIFLLLFLAF